MFDCWEDIWQTVLVVLILSLATLVGTIILEPKDVDYYYLSQGSGVGTTSCVYAHWTWHEDEKAFCTDDYNKALDFTARANATIKK